MLIFIILAPISFVLTYILRIYALKHDVIDVPNERSSHHTPTPRGGGVAILVCFLLSLPFLWFFDLITTNILAGFLVAGVLVSVIGWMDDHGHIKARIRLLIHFTAAIIIVLTVGGLPEIAIAGYPVNLGIIGDLLVVVLLVWVLNLYNFMDGIDGLAASETIISSLCMGALILFWGENGQAAYLAWILAASALGFLFWNFPPAKIFMGDAGSGFLGITLGGLVLLFAQTDQRFLWGWGVMLGVFITDATYTLIKRLIRKEKIYNAHRSHAYQFASRKFNSHLKVTLAVIAINLFWLFPISALIVGGYLDGFLGLILAYTPLIMLAIMLGAGNAEE